MTRLDDIEARLPAVGASVIWDKVLDADLRDPLKIARAAGAIDEAQEAFDVSPSKDNRIRLNNALRALRAALEAVERSDTEAPHD